MSTVGRYVKMRAQPGKGDALAAKMLEVARGLQGTKGCELYVVNRVAGDDETIWITEIWRSLEDSDAALQAEGSVSAITEVRSLLDGAPEVVQLAPQGGAGLLDPHGPGEPYGHVALEDVEDMAPRHGLSEVGEARFATQALGARATGLALQRLRPGRRQAFGHRHERAEEIYVVLSGSGRVKLDDEVREVRALDAIRVDPGVTRAFEAGPEGLELLALGARHAGDGELVMGWWD